MPAHRRTGGNLRRAGAGGAGGEGGGVGGVNPGVVDAMGPVVASQPVRRTGRSPR